jgi:UDP-N-acetylglucosamine/UDP-N-acetylgalactosamine diphosphorylase
MSSSKQVAALLDRGARVLAPETVFVGPEVDPARIEPGGTIHPGCRLEGESLSIGPDCVLGEEGPTTVRDCQFGARVRARGGFLDRSALLDDADTGSCAHVRFGSLLEEHASTGHSVGLKQTVLFPYAVTGSLINFCDCLLAGGTGPKNHSEVGSSYIHFNFTPHQDKATPSLIGDVPQGVLLHQPPIFLGGQGGLVGPCRIACGTVLAAGQVWRRDVTEPGRLLLHAAPPATVDQPYDPRAMGAVDRRVANNLIYIGNLLALDAWWRHARAPFALMPWQQRLHAGALARLDEMFSERIKRLDEFASKVAVSASLASGTHQARQQAFLDAWPALQAALAARIAGRVGAAPPPDARTALPAGDAPSAGYLKWVTSRTDAERAALTAWLQEIVAGRSTLKAYSQAILDSDS